MNKSPQDISTHIQQNSQLLAQAILEDIYGRFPQMVSSDPIAQQKSLRDLGFHLAYLAEAMAVEDVSLFVDYIDWIKLLFANLPLPEDTLNIVLMSMDHVLKRAYSESYSQFIAPYIDKGWRVISDELMGVQDTFIHEKAHLGTLAQKYLQTLLTGERQAGSQLILDYVQDIESVKDVYLYVFQPVQYEIGRLWQTNKITVAEEHYCTAVTQLIMSQLYSYIFTAPRVGRKMVATSVSGELHEIGIRMVTDFFEMNGWDTYYLGANTPHQSIISILQEKKADVLAISATITFHVSEVKKLIQKIRSQPEVASTKILVGGYPFLVAPQLWKAVGADGYAVDAKQAINVAEKLI